MAKKTLQYFADEHHNTHQKRNVLGRGGQGIVYRTSDSDIAIKLATVKDSEKPITNKVAIRNFQTKIQSIKLLPIPENINITKPMAMLKDSAGYVMHLLNEMQPFSHFWHNAKEVNKIKEIPGWLEKIPEESAKQLIHYLKTGGLRRRLSGLAKCASILTELHSMGFIYGDISAENVFISNYYESNELWLIDPDNIRFFMGGSKDGVYTLKYAAPELVQHISGGSFETDCHSFAVLAFWILTLNHPFIGDYVINGGDDWADDTKEDGDLDEKAYAGLFPWIDDKNDDSNYTDNGLPRTLVLTDKLQELFQLTFGVGRTTPWKRPTIFHWPKALMEAYDKTLQCTECKMSFYHKDDLKVCPFCGTEINELITVRTYLYDEENNKKKNLQWIFIREVTSNKIKITLPNRIFFPFSNKKYDVPVLELDIEKSFIVLKKLEIDLDLYYADSNSKTNWESLVIKNRLSISSLTKGITLIAKENIPMLINIKKSR
tara:strand:+ start:4870 stop:6336 length:1467 start_codon:yes stop_codon:yes gene_type:complete